MIKTIYLSPTYVEVLAGRQVEYKKLFDPDYLHKALSGYDLSVIEQETSYVCRSPDLFVGPLEKFVSGIADIPVSENPNNEVSTTSINTRNLCAIAAAPDAVILYAGQKESLVKGSTVENVLTAMASVMPLETLLQTPLYRAYVRLDV